MSALDELSRTALIPFWARVDDGLSPSPILGDRAAVSIAPLVKQRFGVVHVSEPTRVGCCLRNYVIDEWIAQVAGGTDVTVVDIGVGLDTRVQRRPTLAHHYVEVDSAPIISLRDQFLPDTGAHRVSGDGMLVNTWRSAVTADSAPVVLVLERVLPYQEPAKVSTFFSDVARLLPGQFIVFDSVSPLSARSANKPAVRTNGRPPYAWSTWSTRRIRVGPGRLRVIEEKGFMDFPRELTRLFSTMNRVVHAVPPMRRAYRLTLAQLPA